MNDRQTPRGLLDSLRGSFGLAWTPRDVSDEIAEKVRALEQRVGELEREVAVLREGQAGPDPAQPKTGTIVELLPLGGGL